MSRRIELFAALLAACHRTPEKPADPRKLLELYPLRPHVQWVEWRDNRGSITSRAREETWTRDGNRDVWDVITKDREGDATPYHARYALTADGLVQTAIFEGAREIEVRPPKLTLPADPREGRAWEGEHTMGNLVVKRSCKLLAFAKCAGGIEEQCRSVFPDGRMVDVHNRWCRGVGQVSYASITRTAGSDAVIRIWSEDLVDVASSPR